MDQACRFDHAWHGVLPFAWIFEWIPFVDAAFVAGSLATGAAHADSDWDVIVVARPGRLYSARFLCLGILKCMRLRTDIARRGPGFCLNHFIASDERLDGPDDAYSRAMSAGLVPIAGDAEKAEAFLAASGVMRPDIRADLRYRYRKKKISAVALFEYLLSGHVGGACERMARRMQVRRISGQRKRYGETADSRIVVSGGRVELCFRPKRDGALMGRGIDHEAKPNILLGTMTIQPISGHIFLEPLEENRVTKSGILLPDTAEKERPMQGKVVAVGEGKRSEKGDLIPLSVKVGDTVLFKKYGPDEIELEGKKYLVTEEADILAILK